ncbi:putative methyltransferase-domain-containing protein [Microdochium bolleyi]|uniref:Putative methyltransferase-domain-containing protein n=1 Tax=Microdochium bolleyi TaxID=196109 RepID=A0A136JFW7_9PEZI|nr:putative methyltransferase-domain-containing protein [Microdochium bolleyi]
MADPELVLFRRQYRQLFEPDFLSWPPLALLRNDDAQAWLFRNLFDHSRNRYLPPWQYQLCVLETLVRRIAKAAKGDDVHTDQRLIAYLEHLREDHPPDENKSSPGPPSQVEAYITFTCLPGPQKHPRSSQNTADEPDDSSTGEDPTITLLERRNLVVGSKITGFRTWEGCVHLAAYLLSSGDRHGGHIRGRRVLELGAGTGFLSILCAKHLGAKHVLSTDGDEHVVEALEENAVLNAGGGDGQGRLPVTARVLRWGETLDEGSWLHEEYRCRPFDVVLGADITYDKDAVVLLAFTLNELLRIQPQLEVIIASVVRRADSFELFLSECRRFGFTTTEIDFQAKPMREQKALFYAAAMPLKILSIRGPICRDGE